MRLRWGFFVKGTADGFILSCGIGDLLVGPVPFWKIFCSDAKLPFSFGDSEDDVVSSVRQGRLGLLSWKMVCRLAAWSGHLLRTAVQYCCFRPCLLCPMLSLSAALISRLWRVWVVIELFVLPFVPVYAGMPTEWVGLWFCFADALSCHINLWRKSAADFWTIYHIHPYNPYATGEMNGIGLVITMYLIYYFCVVVVFQLKTPPCNIDKTVQRKNSVAYAY